MTTFTFSIKAALRTCWGLFRERPWFYMGMTLILIVLSAPGELGDQHVLLQIFAMILSLIFSYIWLSVSLAAVDAKHDLLSFRALGKHLPTLRQFILLVEVAILTALMVLGGFILLIIPGIYFMTRLAFSQLSLIDNKGRAIAAIKDSWRLVTRDVFWTVLLTILVVVCLAIVGMLLFGIGIIVTYPVATLLLAYLYRTLTRRDGGAITIEPIAETPIEAKQADIV